MENAVETYSPNNSMGAVRNKGDRVEVVVSNSTLNERSTLYADDEDDLRLLVDAALRFFACREIDYKYYPRTYLPWGKDNYWRFDVLGTGYRGAKARSKAEELEPGHIVLLVRESDNQKDENAIRVVLMDGTTIGYVPARRCDDVSSRMGNVGLAIVETNNLYDGEPITVLFAFELCQLALLPWNKIGGPRPRLRIEGGNPIRGKYFDVTGRFKTLKSHSNVIRLLEDFGGIPYWRDYDAKAQILVVGDGSPEKIYDEVAQREDADPQLKVMLEPELVALIEQYQPGWVSVQAKAKAKPKKKTPKDICSARSYISKTLKKIESGTGDIDKLRKGLQERVDMLLAAKEPMGDDLKLRLMYVGVNVQE